MRSATPADRPFLARVYASTREQELAQAPFTPEQRAAFVAQQFEAQSRHYAEHYHDTSFDVIEVDGVAAGRLIVGRWTHEIRIVDIALLPEHRGRGVGSRVLAPVLAEADARGVPATIHVEQFNPAQRLYRRLGFREISREAIYLKLERPVGAGDQAKIA
ncbi:MAG: GNAT family N-acetyltransferase [Patulibacter sp.]|nr:GNAT family N-acetyltransferase [Patulibacter sp.]